MLLFVNMKRNQKRKKQEEKPTRKTRNTIEKSGKRRNKIKKMK